MKNWLRFFLVFLLSFFMIGCSTTTPQIPLEGTIEAITKSSDLAEPITTDKNFVSKEQESQESVERETESEIFQWSEKETESETFDWLEKEGLTESDSESEEIELAEDGVYSSKEDVAKYIFLYGHLPSNFITKKDAEKLGWKGGSLESFAPGMCIGGSRFGNYEGLLPEKEGRFYTECDIDTLGADKRGAKRIVFSNDGLIYYTEDHYKSFELLYGDE